MRLARDAGLTANHPRHLRIQVNRPRLHRIRHRDLHRKRNRDPHTRSPSTAPAAAAVGVGNCIGPAVTPSGSVHLIVGASPESPALIQYTCQCSSIVSTSPTCDRSTRRHRRRQRHHLRRQVQRLHRPRPTIAQLRQAARGAAAASQTTPSTKAARAEQRSADETHSSQHCRRLQGSQLNHALNGPCAGSQSSGSGPSPPAFPCASAFAAASRFETIPCCTQRSPFSPSAIISSTIAGINFGSRNTFTTSGFTGSSAQRAHTLSRPARPRSAAGLTGKNSVPKQTA